MSMFNLAEYNSQISNYIGATIWWEIKQYSKPIEFVQEALIRHGLDESLIHDVSPKVAFKRAGKATSKINSDKDEVHFSRTINDDKNEVVIGIVTEKADKTHDKLNYRQRLTAKLNKETGALEAVGFREEEFKHQFKTYKKNVIDSDIRAMIKLTVDRSGGCALRESGGVYFVPKIRIETLARLERLIDDLGCGKISIMRMCNGEAEREIAWNSAEEEIARRLEKITFAVGNIEKRMPFVTRQQEKLQQVNSLTEYYIELCENQARSESIREKLNAAESMIVQKISDIESISTLD